MVASLPDVGVACANSFDFFCRGSPFFLLPIPPHVTLSSHPPISHQATGAGNSAKAVLDRLEKVSTAPAVEMSPPPEPRVNTREVSVARRGGSSTSWGFLQSHVPSHAEREAQGPDPIPRPVLFFFLPPCPPSSPPPPFSPLPRALMMRSTRPSPGTSLRFRSLTPWFTNRRRHARMVTWRTRWVSARCATTRRPWCPAVPRASSRAPAPAVPRVIPSSRRPPAAPASATSPT